MCVLCATWFPLTYTHTGLLEAELRQDLQRKLRQRGAQIDDPDGPDMPYESMEDRPRPEFDGENTSTGTLTISTW